MKKIVLDIQSDIHNVTYQSVRDCPLQGRF